MPWGTTTGAEVLGNEEFHDDDTLRQALAASQAELTKVRVNIEAAQANADSQEDCHHQSLAGLVARLDELDALLVEEHTAQTEENEVAEELLHSARSQIDEMRVEMLISHAESELHDSVGSTNGQGVKDIECILRRQLWNEQLLEEEVVAVETTVTILEQEHEFQTSEKSRLAEFQSHAAEALNQSSFRIQSYEDWSHCIHDELRQVASEFEVDQVEAAKDRQRLEKRVAELEYLSEFQSPADTPLQSWHRSRPPSSAGSMAASTCSSDIHDAARLQGRAAPVRQRSRANSVSSLPVSEQDGKAHAPDVGARSVESVPSRRAAASQRHSVAYWRDHLCVDEFSSTQFSRDHVKTNDQTSALRGAHYDWRETNDAQLCGRPPSASDGTGASLAAPALLREPPSPAPTRTRAVAPAVTGHVSMPPSTPILRCQASATRADEGNSTTAVWSSLPEPASAQGSSAFWCRKPPPQQGFPVSSSCVPSHAAVPALA